MTNRYRDRTSSDWLHLYNRGADRQDIFSLPGDHDRFEQRMGAMALDCDVEIHAYALLTNHFHFLVHAPGGRVGEMMQRLCGDYASGYNARTGRSGPLFTGRFGSVPIMDEAQLFLSARYIHRNPLDIVGPSALAAYRFSSLGVYLGRRECPPWLVVDELRQLGDARHVIEEIAEPHPADRRSLESIGPVRRTSLDELICAVEQCGASRTAAMTVAVELRVATVVELAEWFCVDPSTVRRMARRGRVQLETDGQFRRMHDQILGHLDAA